MSRTYKDLPYKVKLERYGRPKKNPKEAYVKDYRVKRKIVAIFYAHEVKEKEAFENRIYDLDGSFRIHEISGSLKTSTIAEIEPSDFKHYQKRLPVLDLIKYDRISVVSDGSEFEVKPNYGSITRRMTYYDAFKEAFVTPTKMSKKNVFHVYEAVIDMSNIWGNTQKQYEAEVKELTSEELIKFFSCGCAMCRWEDEAVYSKNNQRARISNAMSNYNSSGKLDDEIEDSLSIL